MAETRRFTKAHPAVKPSHRGRLHDALGVPQGETIPLSRLHDAAVNGSAKVKKMARYAETMAAWKH